ncbi:haloacid dehalogenase [Paenibacillus paeoniae]|uniref:Haloacid dehalogenase n=2 Tax=Paenibacillus paeoniae TaxID=2292705 RepID=A0A371PNX8_9BACL|nr:haloacid dehalogenase [Paenibacillus paeoniae]
MDNTLLRSRIDFDSMKRDTYQYLVNAEYLPPNMNLEHHTTSTIITLALSTNNMSTESIREMWDIPKKYEVRGMKGADLEEGVLKLLDDLRGHYKLAVVTNNAMEAAETALRDHQILSYFDYVVGRGVMKEIKPSPDGFLCVLEHFNSTSALEWISVGDSWIDGKASANAGIAFIAYNGDTEKMNKNGVVPFGNILDIRELKHFL